MARDYKHRAQRGKTSTRAQKYGRQESISGWRWLAIIVVLLSFAAFLTYLRLTPKPVEPAKPEANQATLKQKTPEVKPSTPHFDFYHSLSKKEIVIPEHEIKTRTREEWVGKAKESKYIMQAGSFKSLKEAEQLRAKLALMGIESKVDKVKVGSKKDTTKLNAVIWYRVKIGPYSKMTSVDSVKSRLKKSGIDVMVTELGH
ncbi:MAG: SPOR domain-containing protein [Methylovulum sp.]